MSPTTSYLGNVVTGQAFYEVMIWPATLGGAFLMSYSCEAIATLTIASTGFHLYKGPHGGHSASTILYLLAYSEQSGYSDNLLEFFSFLMEHEGVTRASICKVSAPAWRHFTGSNVMFQRPVMKCPPLGSEREWALRLKNERSG